MRRSQQGEHEELLSVPLGAFFPNFLVLVGPLTAAHHHHQGRIARTPASPQQRERKGERLDGNQAQQRIEREKLL